MMNKKIVSAIAVYAIVMTLFIILSLVIPFQKPAGSWVMFGFSIAAIIGGAAITLLAFSKAKTIRSKFYGFPVFRVGLLYTIIQIASTVIVYSFGAFVQIPFWVGLVISIVFAGLAGIGCIAADNERDYFEAVDSKEENNTKTMMQFQNEILEIVDLCKDASAREVLEKLATKFKFSDLVSTEATAEKEKEISDELKKLKECVKNGETSAIHEAVDAVSRLLSSRNRICEGSKQ